MERSGITDAAVRASVLTAASFQAGDADETIVLAEWFLLWVEGKHLEGAAPVQRVKMEEVPVNLKQVGEQAATHAANRRAERDAAKMAMTGDKDA